VKLTHIDASPRRSSRSTTGTLANGNALGPSDSSGAQLLLRALADVDVSGECAELELRSAAVHRRANRLVAVAAEATAKLPRVGWCAVLDLDIEVREHIPMVASEDQVGFHGSWQRDVDVAAVRRERHRPIRRDAS